jgi:hypothetical protein
MTDISLARGRGANSHIRLSNVIGVAFFSFVSNILADYNE